MCCSNGDVWSILSYMLVNFLHVYTMSYCMILQNEYVYCTSLTLHSSISSCTFAGRFAPLCIACSSIFAWVWITRPCRINAVLAWLIPRGKYWPYYITCFSIFYMFTTLFTVWCLKMSNATIPFLHNVPWKPATQLHVASARLHVPPFVHGFGSQGPTE